MRMRPSDLLLARSTSPELSALPNATVSQPLSIWQPAASRRDAQPKTGRFTASQRNTDTRRPSGNPLVFHNQLDGSRQRQPRCPKLPVNVQTISKWPEID